MNVVETQKASSCGRTVPGSSAHGVPCKPGEGDSIHIHIPFFSRIDVLKGDTIGFWTAEQV